MSVQPHNAVLLDLTVGVMRIHRVKEMHSLLALFVQYLHFTSCTKIKDVSACIKFRCSEQFVLFFQKGTKETPMGIFWNCA